MQVNIGGFQTTGAFCLTRNSAPWLLAERPARKKPRLNPAGTAKGKKRKAPGEAAAPQAASDQGHPPAPPAPPPAQDEVKGEQAPL
jgi:hypothetical protein